MGIFQEGTPTVHCVSAHYTEEARFCELCQTNHGNEVLVIKNRSGKKMHAALPCIKEMIRFRVTDVEELPRWITKLSELKVEHEKRKTEQAQQREEERKRLERKVIVRKRDPASP